jgi:hypothetical protein
MNPRWEQFLRVHGREPKPYEFTLWIGDKWREYREHLGLQPSEYWGNNPRVDIKMTRKFDVPVDDAFNEWLAKETK